MDKGEKGMRIPEQRQPLILSVGRILLKKRWLVFVIGVFIVAIVETIEHWPAVFVLERHFLIELFFYGLAGPAIVWLLLAALTRALVIEMPLGRIQAEVTRSERQRIARDLHDKLAQNLGYLHFKLDQLVATDDTTLANIAAIQADLEMIRQIANQAYEQVRGTLADLRGETEVPQDVVAALQQQAQIIAAMTGLDIRVDDQHNHKPLCPIVKRTIIDIVGEALTNAGKHAQAGQVTISLAYNQTDAWLTVADDGQGFEVSNYQKSGGHYGLDIMRERAEEIGGKLNIKSVPNQGTQLTAQFPNAIVHESLLSKCEHLNCDYLAACQKDEITLS